MGLFNFGHATKKEDKSEGLPWVNVTSLEKLDELIASVSEKPLLLFKHSTRCSVSGMARFHFERSWHSRDEFITLGFVDLLAHRDVSDRIAEITGVRHQSPQVIVLKGNEVIYEASHEQIDAKRIESLVKKT